jgi:perosamine synthetase
MNKKLLTLPVGTSVGDILATMLKKGIRQIPLTDKSLRVRDIVFLTDLKNIPLSSPDITHFEVDTINKVMSTPYLSIGPQIIEFERRISSYVGTKYAVAVNSGTSALHLCVRALDIKDGDEIITTPFSFIASANCALYERAVPVFADIDEKTLCIDPSKIEEKITSRTKAIIPVHVFGYPCDMDKIMRIARRHKLAVIEDSCESLGTKYKNKMTGAIGDAGVFAFYPNKQITTAEGGMLVTNNEKIARLARSMRNQGRDEHSAWLSHNRLGYNYRMSELNAALGCVQVRRINEILAKRRRIASAYDRNLGRLTKYIRLPYHGKTTDISWFVYVIRLNETMFDRRDRDKIMRELKSRGISCSNYFPPIHLEPFYAKKFGYKAGDFPVTEAVSAVTIALPFHTNLKKSDVAYISRSLGVILKKVEKSS